MNSVKNQIVLSRSSVGQSVVDLHSGCALPGMFQTDAVDHIMFYSAVDSGVIGEIVDIHSVNEPFVQSAMTSLSYDRTLTVRNSLLELSGLGFSYPVPEDEVSHPTRSLRTKVISIEDIFNRAWHLETPLEPNGNSFYSSESIWYKTVTADLNQMLQDARREILDQILTAVGTQVGLPSAVLDPVFEEIITEAKEHLQFEYDATESSDAGLRSPVRLSGEFDVQGQTVTFETPFIPILMERDDLGAPFRWSLNTDLNDWISEAQRVLNVDF